MKIDWKLIGKSVAVFLQKRSPEILTGIGIAGMGASVVLAVKGSKKAKEAIDDGKLHTKSEVFKKTWKYYVPAAVSFGAGASCVIFASHTNYRRNAALAAACSVAESALNDYKSAVVETIGEKKEALIEEVKAKKQVQESNGPGQDIIFADSTDTICYDPWSDRYFRRDIDRIKRAIEDLSYQLRDDEFVTLNEFYDLIDVDRTKAGEVLGWNANGGPIRPMLSSTLAKGQACLVIGFSRYPTESYLSRF